MTELEKEIEALENQIKNEKQRLAELRRKLEPKKVDDYLLKDSFGNDVRLSQLFGNHNELILIHNMGLSCTSCTMWADGFNGVVSHLENRASFVVESPEDPHIQRQFAADRGWKFRMVSSKGTPFRKDMGFASDTNSPWPGVTTFRKDSSGKIDQLSSAGFGPGDNFCIVWDLFDLLPEGWKDWDTDYFYSKVK